MARQSKLSDRERRRLRNAEELLLGRLDSLESLQMAQQRMFNDALARSSTWDAIETARTPAELTAALRRMEEHEAAAQRAWERRVYDRDLTDAERDLIAPAKTDWFNSTLASSYRDGDMLDDGAGEIADQRLAAAERRTAILRGASRDGGRAGGVNSGQQRRATADVHDRQVLSDAIKIVEERDTQCGDGCDRPCRRHRPRNGWSQRALAQALFNKYRESKDMHFASWDVIRQRLRRQWPVLNPVLRRLPQHLADSRAQARLDTPGADLEQRARDILAERIIDRDVAIGDA